MFARARLDGAVVVAAPAPDRALTSKSADVLLSNRDLSRCRYALDTYGTGHSAIMSGDLSIVALAPTPDRAIPCDRADRPDADRGADYGTREIDLREVEAKCRSISRQFAPHCRAMTPEMLRHVDRAVDRALIIARSLEDVERDRGGLWCRLAKGRLHTGASRAIPQHAPTRQRAIPKEGAEAAPAGHEFDCCAQQRCGRRRVTMRANRAVAKLTELRGAPAVYVACCGKSAGDLASDCQLAEGAEDGTRDRSSDPLSEGAHAESARMVVPPYTSRPIAMDDEASCVAQAHPFDWLAGVRGAAAVESRQVGREVRRHVHCRVENRRDIE